MEKMIPKTYAEAIKMGYRQSAISYQRGYISRKTVLENQPIHVAGGRKHGKFYVLAPCFNTTRYCFRVYLEG